MSSLAKWTVSTPILRTARCFGGESGHGFLGLQKPQGTGNPGKLWRKYDAPHHHSAARFPTRGVWVYRFHGHDMIWNDGENDPQNQVIFQVDRPKDRKVIENDNQDENGGSHFYHLVMANSLPWKIPNHKWRFSSLGKSSINGPSIPWLCQITRWYFGKLQGSQEMGKWNPASLTQYQPPVVSGWRAVWCGLMNLRMFLYALISSYKTILIGTDCAHENHYSQWNGVERKPHELSPFVWSVIFEPCRFYHPSSCDVYLSSGY